MKTRAARKNQRKEKTRFPGRGKRDIALERGGWVAGNFADQRLQAI
jgi:hypothetical protein